MILNLQTWNAVRTLAEAFMSASSLERIQSARAEGHSASLEGTAETPESVLA